LNSAANMTDANSPDQIARVIGAGSAGNLQAAINEAKTRAASGQFGDAPDLSLFTPGTLRANAVNLHAKGMPTSIQQVMSASNPLQAAWNNLQIFDSQVPSPAYTAMKPYIANGGKLTGPEADVVLSTASPDTIKSILLDPTLSKQLDADATNHLTGAYYKSIWDLQLRPIFATGGLAHGTMDANPTSLLNFNFNSLSNPAAVEAKRTELNSTVDSWAAVSQNLKDWAKKNGDPVSSTLALGQAHVLDLAVNSARVNLNTKLNAQLGFLRTKDANAERDVVNMFKPSAPAAGGF
jgi:hypothetical protein